MLQYNSCQFAPRLGRFFANRDMLWYNKGMIGSILLFSILAAAPAVPVPSVSDDVSIEEVPVVTPTYAGVAISDEEHEPLPATKNDVALPQSSSTPLISINTDSVLDMNWTGAMELSDPVLRPMPVVLPFLESYPIDNIEVKLRLLNLSF